jgi:RNA polymerase sigma-70 factor (ECF subfamily)
MTEASPDRDSSDEHASPEALAQLSLAFRSSLTRYFQRRVSAPAEIDDLVQEVFLRLLVRGGVEDMASVSGYVFETASSVLKDRYRRRVTRHADDHVPMGTDGEEGQDFSAERVHQGRELLHEAAMELLAMPERTRTVCILRVLEGLSYKDISHRLGISVSAVEKHMTRALKRLVQRCGDAT